MNSPSLSIVINTSGRLDCLPHSLGSVARECSGRGGVEVILVDNSPDGCVRAVHDQWLSAIPVLRYEREPVLGLVSARNAALRVARHDVVAYVDDDAVVHPGWIDALRATYRSFWNGSQPIVVGGKVSLLYPENVARPDWLSPELEKWLTSLDFGPNDRVLDHPREALVGANFTAPLSTFRRIGGFPDLGASYSDERSVEYLVLRAGGRVVYSAGAHVDHMVHPGRLNRKWFIDRYYKEGFSRQQVMSALAARSRPSHALRLGYAALRLLGSRMRQSVQGRDSVAGMHAACVASYYRGSMQSSLGLLKSGSRPLALKSGNHAQE